MRYLIVKRSQIIILFVVFSVCAAAFSLPLAVTQAMAAKRDVPITSVKTEKMQISLTANVYTETDIEALLAECNSARVTFFISDDVQNFQPEKVLLILSKGHTVGILEDDMSGKAVQEINNRIAARIESLARLTGKNAELIRFDENRYDAGSVKAIYRLGLFPVQWSTDDTAEHFSKGDIILITGESDTESFIKKTAADGYESVSLDELIIKESYKVDLRGEQTKK